MYVSILLAGAALLAWQPESPTPHPQAALLEEITSEIERLSTLRFPSVAETERLDEQIDLLIEAFPDEPTALMWAGKRADQYGRGHEARELFEKALESSSKIPGIEDAPVWTTCNQLLGEMALAQGDLPKARNFANKAIQLQPEDPRSYRILVDIAFRSGELSSALQKVRTAYDNAPDNLSLALFYCDLLSNVGDWTTLQEVLRKAPAEHSRHFHLFRARLAELEGDVVSSIAHLLFGHWNGDADRFVAQECRNLLDQYNRADATTLPKPADLLVEGFFVSEDKEAAKAILPRLTDASADSDAAQKALDHVEAESLTETGALDQAKAKWQALLDADPYYLPAIVCLGEIVQAQGDSKAADELFQRARKLSSSNGHVRRLDRLGGDYDLAANGVRIRSVESKGYLDAFGLRPGDIVLRLDRTLLSELPPFERLRKMRLFQGGTVQYETPDGRTHEREMELILFGF